MKKVIIVLFGVVIIGFLGLGVLFVMYFSDFLRASYSPYVVASVPYPQILHIEPITDIVIEEISKEDDYEDEKEEINAEYLAMNLKTINNELLPWNLQLVNHYNFLPADFTVELASIGNGHYIDARAFDSFVAMLNSAREEGLNIIVTSSFRTITHQRRLFDNRIARFMNENGLDFYQAVERTRQIIAYPGSSEHNLGLAIDFISREHKQLNAAFAQTPEGIWLRHNSYQYGFILRYNYNKTHITNFIYEPWHFRYVGAKTATTMFENNWSLEEYIAILLHNITNYELP